MESPYLQQNVMTSYHEADQMQTPSRASHKAKSSQPSGSSVNSHWPCTYCSRVYPQKSRLLIHMREEHGASGGHKCTICGKLFSDKSNLRRHKRSHPGEDSRYQCQICGKRMVTKANFEGHMNIHAGIKPFKCDQCGTSFSNFNYMLYHKKCKCSSM